MTGKETIYQMMALADAIRERGGQALEPLVYKKMYLDRLWLKIRDRIEALRSRTMAPDRYLVPGARQLLEDLSGRGLRLYSSQRNRRRQCQGGSCAARHR